MLIIIISKPFEEEDVAEDSVVDKGLIVDSVVDKGLIGFYHLVVTSKKWRSLERSDGHLRSDEQMVGH